MPDTPRHQKKLEKKRQKQERRRAARVHGPAVELLPVQNTGSESVRAPGPPLDCPFPYVDFVGREGTHIFYRE